MCGARRAGNAFEEGNLTKRNLITHDPPPRSRLANRRSPECPQGGAGTQQGAVSTRPVGRGVRAALRKRGKMPRGAFLLAFAGISEIKAAEREIEVARAYLDSIIATIRQPLVVLDEELRVISASSSFYQVFRSSPKNSSGGTSWLQAIISMCPRFANSWSRSKPEARPSPIRTSRWNCQAWDGGHFR